MNIFVFDIETIPAVENGQQLYNLQALNDSDTARALTVINNGNEFLPHYLHQVIAISVVLRTPNALKVWSLGNTDSSEKEIIQRFFQGIEKYTPTLVTWNGSGFDLPVLHYRALLHAISAPRYWETGDNESSFRWNNYLSRYHYRHLDLMDVLASYQARAYAPLDAIATMLGFPGKMGMKGNKVWDYFLQNDIVSIRNYCETDVLNTYLVYLRFELMRGKLLPEQYEQECEFLRTTLQQENKPHFNQFLEAWAN